MINILNILRKNGCGYVFGKIFGQYVVVSHYFAVFHCILSC